MVDIGMEVDLHAYTSLIWGLSRWGKLNQARELFDEMITNGVMPDEVVYNCLVRKYYEIGKVDEALELQNEIVKTGLITGDGDYGLPKIQT